MSLKVANNLEPYDEVYSWLFLNRHFKLKMDISVKLQIPFQHHMLILHVADQWRLVSGIQFVHSDLSLHPTKMRVFLNYK